MNKLFEKLSKQLPLVGLELILLMIFLGHAFTESGSLFHSSFIERLENLAYDARVRLTMPNDVDDRIVIVDIDEKSLSKIGRWPWGRDKMASLINQLFDHYKVEMVGFDIVFASPDESSGLSMLEKLGKNELSQVNEFQDTLGNLRQELDYDQRFVDSLKDRPVFVGYFFEKSDEGEDTIKTGLLPPPNFDEKDFTGKTFEPPVADGFGASLDSIHNAARGAGHFNPSLDSDGIVRKVPLYYEFEGEYYEALSLVMVRHLLKTDKVELHEGFNVPGSSYNAFDYLKVSDHLIPINERSEVLVPYRGREGSFPYISAIDVIDGSADLSALNDRIIIIGTSAKALFDLRATPVQEDYPGVEVHANLIAGILDGRLKERPYYVLGAEIVLLLLVGLFMALYLPSLSPHIAAIVTFAIATVSLLLNFLVWQYFHIVMPIASGLLLILALFILNMSYGFFIAQRGKRQIEGIFGQYVPPELVDEMSDDPDNYSLDAEVRELTVLFSDIRDFTSISESMEAQDLSDMLNEYLTPMTEIIQDTRGTIDKYIGDAVMAFWGAPLRQENHALYAVQSAIKMVEALPAMNEEFRAKGWPEVRIGIGLNTGPMRVGDMGSDFRKAYTVMGDAVNLGARLEGQTKNYGVEILISETTKKAVPEYLCIELDKIRVKGKDKPVSVYQPIALKAEVDDKTMQVCKYYMHSLQLYRQQKWDTAEMQFTKLLKKDPASKLYKLYIERIQAFRQNPPGEHWDGVFTYTTK